MERTTLPNHWRRRLTEARTKLAEARVAHETAAWALDSAVHNAIEAGHQVTQIADAAGISRETAYRAYDRHEAWLRPQLGDRRTLKRLAP